MKTRLTDLLGIRYPIVQAGSSCAGEAELPAAVSNAGGMGMLVLPEPAEFPALVAAMAQCRRLTGQPLGLSLAGLLSRGLAPGAASLEAAIDHGIGLVETAGRVPKALIERCKRQGLRVMHRCGQLHEALEAERNGVDLVSLCVHDTATSPTGERRLALALIPQAAHALRIPVVVCGEITGGAGLAAALALGAEGMRIGEHFLMGRKALELAHAQTRSDRMFLHADFEVERIDSPDWPACGALIECMVRECREALSRACEQAAVRRPLRSTAQH